MDPVRVAHWVAMKLGPEATRAVRDAFDQALVTIPTEAPEDHD
jgi:hypothetical protein